MSLWSQIESDASAVLLNDFDGMTVTAFNIKTGQQFTAFFIEGESERDQKYGVANTVRGSLWVPVTCRPQLQEQWRVIRQNGEQVEVTAVSYGARSGGLLEIKVEKLTVVRFKGAGELT